MAVRYRAYRRSLTQRAQALRRDPTPAERKLWYEFLSALPHKFTRQKPLGRYIADFYCASSRLVIELDGDSHYTPDGERYDERRTDDLRSLGIRIVRSTNADVMRNFESVCSVVEKMLEES